jgi:hypothetical protein
MGGWPWPWSTVAHCADAAKVPEPSTASATTASEWAMKNRCCLVAGSWITTTAATAHTSRGAPLFGALIPKRLRPFAAPLKPCTYSNARPFWNMRRAAMRAIFKTATGLMRAR